MFLNKKHEHFTSSVASTGYGLDFAKILIVSPLPVRGYSVKRGITVYYAFIQICGGKAQRKL